MISRVSVTLTCLVVFSLAGQAVAQKADAKKPAVPERASAYYHYTMGHLYGELATSYSNRSDYLNKAIDHYRQALKLDPGSAYLAEELCDLYLQANRLREGVNEAEEALRQNPDNLGARRILGRIYTRLIGDPSQGTINRDMLRRAIEQYQKISEKSPKELDTWLVLGKLYKISQQTPEAESAYKKVIEIDPGNEDALTGLATVYSDIGDNARASEMMRKLAEKNPSLRNLAILAQNYEQMRDYKSAAQALSKALELQPENRELKKALGQNLMFADNLDAALRIFSELEKSDPKDPIPALRISQIYTQKRDFQKAHEAGQRAVDLDPNNVDIAYNQVSMLDAEGKTTEAIGVLKEMLAGGSRRIYGTDEKAVRATLLERLGMLYRNSDQVPQAVETFHQAAELDSGRGARIAMQVVETYRLAKEFGKAIQEADAAVKKYPEDRMLASLHASVLTDMGRNEQAITEMRKLIGSRPDRETWLSLAQLYEKTKNYEEMGKAIDEAEKASMGNDEKKEVHFLRGVMWEKRKNLDASETEFRKVLELDPNNAGALNYLGYMLADRGVRLQEAHQLVTKALEQEPNNGAYLDSLGWVYYHQDRLKEAEQSLLRALERYSRDPTVHDHLGDVYFKQGRVKEAITQWQNSLKEWDQAAASEQDPAEVAKVQKKLEGAKVRLAKEGSPAKQP